MVLPELTDEWVAENLGEFDTVEAWRDIARRAARHAQAQPGPQTSSSSAPPRRWPSWSTSSRPSRWSQATCRPASRTPCSSSRRRASRSTSGSQATGQDPAQFVESCGAVGAGGQGRPRPARRRRRRGARGRPTTTSTPSTPASPCRSARRPDQVRKAYERNDAVADLRRPDPQAQGARLAARARRGRRHRGQADRPCAAARSRSRRRRRPRPRRTITTTTTTTITTDHDSRPRARRARSRPREGTDAWIRVHELPGSQRRRADQPRRAGLRPLLRLLKEHIIFLGTPIDDTIANLICAQLLHLESREPRQGHQHLHQLARRRHHRAVRDLRHDAVHQAPTSPRSASARPRRPPRCCSPPAPGQALRPAARPGPAPPAVRQVGSGQAADIEIQAKEILRMRDLLDEILAHHTGQTDRAGPQGHRPRLHHGRGRGQGVRHHRRGHHVSRRGRPHRSDPLSQLSRRLERGRLTWRSSETAASC